MKIVSLAAENFKRIRAIMIRPDGSTVIVGGKNGAGKSSALDAIRAALGGKKECPEEPIRRGAKKAQIVLESEELTVTRTFSKKGTQLEVTAKDGSAFASPQTMLDKLVGSLSFDPLEFSRMKPVDQSDVVRRLVGLDFSELDLERAGLYEERRNVTRDYKQTVTRLGPEITDAPTEEISVSEAMTELSRRHDINDVNRVVRGALDGLVSEVAEIDKKLKDGHERFAQIKEAHEKSIGELEQRKEAVQRDLTDTKKRASAKDQDTDEIEATIAGAEESNRKFRAASDRAKTETEVEILTKTGKGLSAKIGAIDERKAEAIQSAKYPIDGLRITDDGVELNDLPFEQASSAEQLRCSVAMGLALNPELKVLLVKDGSLLDEDSLRMIAEMADKAEAQIWIERVGRGDECTVIIEDGSTPEERENAI